LTAVVVILMGLGLIVAVGYPLWKGVKEESLPPFAAELVVQDGVAYSDADELALDRALGRVKGKVEAMTLARRGLDEELERRVAVLRQEKGAVPASTAAAVAQPVAQVAGSCPQCGHSHDAGDRFCARCGASLTHACPNCGRLYDAGDLFCAKCGQKL
jgi:hypothetical protein